MTTRLALVFGIAVFATGQAMAVEYEKDILPIFEKKCFNCHGNGKSKGATSLEAARIMENIDFSIIPGEPEKSSIYTRLTTDDDDRMPPPGKGTPLSSSEVNKVEQWIKGLSSGGGKTAESGMTEGFFKKKPEPVDGKWTDVQGRTITATLVEVKGETAVLRMNGKDYPVPFTKLSKESLNRVKEFAAQ